MSNQPKTVTVCITSFNQPGYLSIAFQSVLNQTRPVDQIVIIDDASTDESQDLIRSFQREHENLVHPILNPTNQGVSESRKLAVLASIGDFITFLDGDDLYLPEKIELQEQALLQSPTAGYAYSNFAYIDQDGNQTGIWNENSKLPSGNIFEYVATRNFPHGACHRNELIRRVALLEAMDYEKGRNLYEDFDTLLRLSRFNTAVVVDRVTHLYRINPTGLSKVSYPEHYEALNYVYSKNKHLLQDLDIVTQKRIQAGINTLLSQHAWGSVRQMAKGQIKADRNAPSHGPLHYAKAGITHQPSTVINPKLISQLIRAMIRR